MTDVKIPTAVPFLRYPGGILCPIEDADNVLLYPAVNNPDQRHLFDRYEPKQWSQQVEWTQGLSKRADTNQVFKLVEDGGTFIATMGLHSINWKNRTAITGAMMFNPDFWGKQHGRNAKMVLLDHAFNRLNLELIESRALEFNERSRRYSLACGYVEDGFLPGRHLIEGKRYGEYVLSVTRATWEPIWEKFRAEHQIESFEEMLVRTMKPRSKS